MSMKKTDLEKNKAIKLREGVQKAPVPTRFGVASTAVPDRREQRRLDQAAGLVPFACKLKDELVQRLRALAEQEGGDLNALTERLIRAGLSAEGVRVPTAKKAAPPASAKKVAVKLPTVKAPAKAPAQAPAKPAAATEALVQPGKKAASKPTTTVAAQPAAAKKAAATKTAAKPAPAKKVPAKKAATPTAVVANKAPAKKAAAKKATPVKTKKA